MRLREYVAQAFLTPSLWMEDIKMPRNPFAHQIDDLRFMANCERCGLFNEAGTGKTLPMQAYGLFKVSSGLKGIFLMPPILIPQFLGSAHFNFPGFDKFVTMVAFNGGPTERANLLAKWSNEGFPDILVMSYAIFVKLTTEFPGELPAVYNWIVVDEATAVKAPSSQIHKAVHAFGDGTGNNIVLATGTPIETNVQDAYGLIRLITPGVYSSFKNFEYMHMRYETVYNHKTARDVRQLYGYANLELLHDNLYRQARRVLKSDVSDLPPRLVTEYLVELSKPHKNLYNKMVQDRMLEIGDELVDMTTYQALYQAMQQVLLNPEKYGKEIKDNALFEALDEIMSELEGRKIIVYAWFNSTVDFLCERYAHLNPAKINGSVTGDARENEKQKFIQDESCKMLVANPKSGGVGVDGLQHVCSHVVFAEVIPFIGTFQQAVARVHRTGQVSESVNIYFLVAKNTIAVKLRNNLAAKDLAQEQVMKDKRAILADLMGEEGIQGSLDLID